MRPFPRARRHEFCSDNGTFLTTPGGADMPAIKEKTIRRQLESLITRLRPEVSSMTEQALSPSGGQGANELSNVPYHLGYNGTEEYLHDLNATLLENEEYLANEVRAALRRLDDGAFG